MSKPEGIRCVDIAWSRIVDAAGHVRGKVFRMNRVTHLKIMDERRLVVAPPLLYGIPIMRDESLPFGRITLENR